MNVSELCSAIRARLVVLTEYLQLETEDKNTLFAKPQIVSGYLPPKRSQSRYDFPHIIVRPATGTADSASSNTVDVKLVIGVYSEEFDGYEAALLVMETIYRGFVEQPILPNTPFCFELPFNWTLPDDQPWPEWQLEVVTRWSIAAPQTTIPIDDVYEGV